MSDLPAESAVDLGPALARWQALGGGLVMVLTGAGISAESGIPTFRGDDGWWTVGSRNYTPMELATAEAFAADPATVWSFYLARIGRYGSCAPNAAHHALVALERRLDERFLLITQNVDGLHRSAGQDPRRTYAIHGELSRVRCAQDCGASPEGFPESLRRRLIDRVAAGEVPGFDEEARMALTCRGCGGLLRPHVLWFDEYYDEANFRWDSTLQAATRADLLVVVGTSGATNLPLQVMAVAEHRRAGLVVVGPEDSVFSAAAQRTPHGVFLRGTATRLVPELVEQMSDHGGLR